MAETEKALAAGKLRPLVPRHFTVDLDEHAPGTEREEIMEPEFWAESPVLPGDTVTLTCSRFVVQCG
jgi:hypothetical protein